jgi:hypothetical protein
MTTMTIAEVVAYFALPAFPRLTMRQKVDIMVYLGQRLSPVELCRILDSLVFLGRVREEYAQEFATIIAEHSTAAGAWTF